MEVTHPAWRAPIRKGDSIRITGVYENRDHAWYDVDDPQGDLHRPAEAARGLPALPGRRAGRSGDRGAPQARPLLDLAPRPAGGGCRHRRGEQVGIDPVEGVPNRAWGQPQGPRLRRGGRRGPCERAEPERPPGASPAR